MTRTIFFDLDGTLTASGPGIMNCARLALAHYNIPAPEEMRMFIGPPLRVSFAKFGLDDEDVTEAIRIFRSRYTTIGLYENAPYDGIFDLLERLRADGHRLFVATSKPETMAVEILSHFGLTKYFDLICGATLDARRESKSLVLAYLLEQVEDPQSVVMVGDTRFDVIGANEHRIPTIGVTWGYGTREELEEAGAVAVAESMDELYALLG